MCDQTEIEYKAGEVVWCKLGNMWWPAQVQNQEDLDEEVTQGLRKRPLAVVKFFKEDFYDFVKDIKHICHYNSSRKFEFIRKGMDCYRSMGKTNQMSKFPQDIIMAEEITGGNTNILDDPRLAPEEKINYKDVFTTPKTQKDNKIIKRSKHVSVKGKLLSRFSPAYGKPGYEKKYFTKYLIQKCVTPNTIQYHCPDCNFVCSRLVLLSYHRSYNKYHGCPKPPLRFMKANSSSHKVEKAVMKRKSVGNETSPLKKKAKPPIKGPSDEPPKKMIKVKAVVKQETKEKDKKKAEAMREQLLLDWNEEEGEESDDVAQDIPDAVECKLEEKPADQSINSTLTTSCFDFEDNEEDMNMDRSIRFGQKLPRVIPREDKTKDGKTKERNSQDDGLEEKFNSLMKETVVPILTDPFLLDSSALPGSSGKAEANLGSKANNEEENMNMEGSGGNQIINTQPPSEVYLLKKLDDDNSSLLRALESDSPAEFEHKEYSGKSLKRCNTSSSSENITKKLKSDADLLASLRSDSDSNSSPPDNLVADKGNSSLIIPFDKPSGNLEDAISENIQIESSDTSALKENEVNSSKTRFSSRRSCSSKYNDNDIKTSAAKSLEKSSSRATDMSKSGEFIKKKEKSPRKIMPVRRCSIPKNESSDTTRDVLKSTSNTIITSAKIETKEPKGGLEPETSGPIRRSSTRRSTSSQPDNNSDETSSLEVSVEKRIAMLLSDSSSSESPNDSLPLSKKPSPSSMAKYLAKVQNNQIYSNKQAEDKIKSADKVNSTSLSDARKKRFKKLLLEKRRGTSAGKITGTLTGSDKSAGRENRSRTHSSKDSKPRHVNSDKKGQDTSKDYSFANRVNTISRKSRSQTKSVEGSKKILSRLSSDSPSPIRSPTRVSLKSPSNIMLKAFARPNSKNQPKSFVKAERKSPARGLKSPTREMKSPTRGTKNPTGKLKSPTRVMKSPTGRVMKSPTREMKSPTRRVMKSPTREMKSPTRRVMKSPTREMKSSTGRVMKSPTREMKSSTGRIMRSPTREMKSPTRRVMKSPTRELKSPTRAEIKSSNRIETKSPKRGQMRSPAGSGMKSPSGAEIIKSPSRPSSSALKMPRKSSVSSATASNQSLIKTRSEVKVIKSEPRKVSAQPDLSAPVSKGKRLVSSRSGKSSDSTSKKKRVFDDPCSELFKPDIIISSKPSSNVSRDSVTSPPAKSKFVSSSRSSDNVIKHSKNKLLTKSFQKHDKYQSTNKAPIESKPPVSDSSFETTALCTIASAEASEDDSMDSTLCKEALKISSIDDSIDREALKVSSGDAEDLVSKYKKEASTLCKEAHIISSIDDSVDREALKVSSGNVDNLVREDKEAPVVSGFDDLINNEIPKVSSDDLTNNETPKVSNDDDLTNNETPKVSNYDNLTNNETPKVSNDDDLTNNKEPKVPSDGAENLVSKDKETPNVSSYDDLTNNEIPKANVSVNDNSVNKEVSTVSSYSDSINKETHKDFIDNSINKEVISGDAEDLIGEELTFSDSPTKINLSSVADNSEKSGLPISIESELHDSKDDSSTEEKKFGNDLPRSIATITDSTSYEIQVSKKSDTVAKQHILAMDSIMSDKNNVEHFRETENICQSQSSPMVVECTTLTSDNPSSENLLLASGKLTHAQISVLPETAKLDEEIIIMEPSQSESNEGACDGMKADEDSSSQSCYSLGKPVELMEEILEEEGSPHKVSHSLVSATQVKPTNTVELNFKNNEQAFSETDNNLTVGNSIFCSGETGGENFSLKNAVRKEEDSGTIIPSQSEAQKFNSHDSDDFKTTNNCLPQDSPTVSVLKKEFLTTPQDHTSEDLETEVINSLNETFNSPRIIHPHLSQTEDSVDKAMEEMFSCDVPTDPSTRINIEFNNDSSSTENQLSILNEEANKTVLPREAVIEKMESVVPEVENSNNPSGSYPSTVVEQMAENISNIPEFPNTCDENAKSKSNGDGSSESLEQTVKPVYDEKLNFDTAAGHMDASTTVKTDELPLLSDTGFTFNCSGPTSKNETNYFDNNDGITEKEDQHGIEINVQVDKSEEATAEDIFVGKSGISSEEQVSHLPDTLKDSTQISSFDNIRLQPLEDSKPQAVINSTSDEISIKPDSDSSAPVSDPSKQSVLPFAFKTEPHFSIDLTEEEDPEEVGTDYPNSEIVISQNSGSELPEADSLQAEKEPPTVEYTDKLDVESEVVINSEIDDKLESNMEHEASQNTQTVLSEVLINESDHKIEGRVDINLENDALASEIIIDSESEDRTSMSFNFNAQATSEVVITSEASDKISEDIYHFDKPVVRTQLSSETTQLPPLTTYSFGDVKLTNPRTIMPPKDYPNIAVPDDFLTADKIKEILKHDGPSSSKTQKPQTSTLIRPIVVPPQSLLSDELNPSQTVIAGGPSLSQDFTSQDVNMELDINSMPIVIDDSPEDDVPTPSTSTSLSNQSSSSDTSIVKIAMLPANRRPTTVPYNYYIKLVKPGACKPKPQSGCVVLGIPAAANSHSILQSKSIKTIQFVSQGNVTRSEEYKEYKIASSQGKKSIVLQHIDEFPTKKLFKPVGLANKVRTIANSRRIVSNQNVVNSVQPNTLVPPPVRVITDSGTRPNLNYRAAFRSEPTQKVVYRAASLSLTSGTSGTKRKSILKSSSKTFKLRMDPIKDHRISSSFTKPPGILKVSDRSAAGRRLIASSTPCLDTPEPSTSGVVNHRNPSRAAPKEDILAKALADTQVFQETEVSNTPASTYIEPTHYRSVSSNVPCVTLGGALVTTNILSYNIASTSFSQNSVIQPSMPLLSDETALSQSLSAQNNQSAIPIFQLDGSQYVFVTPKTKATTDSACSISQASNFNSNLITCSSSETSQTVSNSTQLTADINLAEIELPPGQPPNEPSGSNVFNDITTIPLPPEPFNNTMSPSGFLSNPTDNICNSPENHNLTSLFQSVSNSHIS